METFRYQARGRGGASTTGTITAESLQDAIKSLRAQSLFPTQIEKQSNVAKLELSFGSGVSQRVLAQFYSQLADLLRSGVPLLRSLTILQERAPTPKLGTVVKDIARQVADGESIAEAMQQHQRIFGELTISMVRAGQEGGFLEDVFDRIAVFTEQQEDLKGKVVGALAYPLFLSVIGAGVVATLLIYFVPKFAQIFDRLRERGELPAATETLLLISETLRNYGIFVLIAGVVGYLALTRALQTEQGRRLIDTAKLRMPLFGTVWRDLAITRFDRVLGTLRRNGVPILNALRIAKDSTGNILMQEAIGRAADNVRGGDKLATPLRASGVFPLEMVEMIEVAEESNTLEDVLISSADRLEKRTTRRLEIAVRFLEPLMLLVMAAITLVVVVALLLPIFRMSSALS